MSHITPVEDCIAVHATANNPHLYKNGKVNLAGTLRKNNVPATKTNVRVLQSFLKMSPRERTINQGINPNIGSLPLAEGVTWKMAQTPSVYAIVCEPSGNAYIGSSTRPDLRRAVHLYWLKNMWTPETSNVYFGNVKLHNDIKEHGVSSFRLHIIESMPDASLEELQVKEKAFLTKHGLSKCYNKTIDSNAPITADETWKDIEPELYAMSVDYWKKQKALLKDRVDYSELNSKSVKYIKQLNEDRKTGKISFKYQQTLLNELSKHRKQLRNAIKAKIVGHRELHKAYITKLQATRLAWGFKRGVKKNDCSRSK